MKLPLRIDPGSRRSNRAAVTDDENCRICEGLRHADASLIVAAVNSHQSLRLALSNCIDSLQYVETLSPSMIDRANIAIAASESPDERQ